MYSLDYSNRNLFQNDKNAKKLRIQTIANLKCIKIHNIYLYHHHLIILFVYSSPLILNIYSTNTVHHYLLM